MPAALNTPEMIFAKDLMRRIREEAPRPLYSWELVISKGQKFTSWKARKTGRGGGGPPNMVLTVSDRYVHAPQSILNDIATQLSSILRGEWSAARAATGRIQAWSVVKRKASLGSVSSATWADALAFARLLKKAGTSAAVGVPRVQARYALSAVEAKALSKAVWGR